MIGYTITEKNCNGILTVLYKERDKISERISQNEWKGLDTTILEKQYNDICDQIDEACEFRRHHNCLLEGDPGFSFC